MRPIDMQGMVTRTQDIERMHRIQQQHPLQAQEQFSERLRKEAEENLKRVRSAEESYLGIIRDKKEEGPQRQTTGDRKRQEQKSEARDDSSGQPAGDQVKGRHIDVTA